MLQSIFFSRKSMSILIELQEIDVQLKSLARMILLELSFQEMQI